MVSHVQGHVELSIRESRQGESSRRTSWVLYASLGLAVIAGIAVYFTFLPA